MAGILISRPTQIRKKGIKSAFPIKSIRLIKGELLGISRLRERPARKAPMMGSTPDNSKSKAAIKTRVSTKI